MIFKKNGNIVENLGDIRPFVEAANLGGLSVAGRKLGLSPAAASARLVKLEATLHTRLFERTTRQLRLTEEGRIYLWRSPDVPVHALRMFLYTPCTNVAGIWRHAYGHSSTSWWSAFPRRHVTWMPI